MLDPIHGIQDASKFMRHSKRHTLSTEDINSALIANLKEVVSQPFFKPLIPAIHANSVLIFSVRDVSDAEIVYAQPIYGYGSKVPVGFSTPQGMRDTFFVQDKITDIKEVRRETSSSLARLDLVST